MKRRAEKGWKEIGNHKTDHQGLPVQRRNLRLNTDNEKEHDPLFSGQNSAFLLSKAPQWLEPILQPDEPGEKEMRIPDVKVSEIEEECVVQPYRISQSILDP